MAFGGRFRCGRFLFSRFFGGRFSDLGSGGVRAVVNGLQTVGAYPNSYLYGSQGAISIEVEGVVQTNVDYGSTEGASDLASGVTNPPDVDAFDTHDPDSPFLVYWSVPGTDYSGSFAFRHAVPGINADPTINYASGDRPRFGSGANWSGVGFGSGGGEWFLGGTRADSNPGTQVIGATAIGAGTTFQTPPNAAHEDQPIWFRQFNPTSGGIAYAWSEFVIGPDLTADTVSLAITYDNVDVSIVATTSDEGMLHTVLADPANAPSAAQVLLGQDGTGAAAPYYNNGAVIAARGEQAPVDVPGMSGDIAAYSVLVDSNANESNRASTPSLNLDAALPPTATTPRQAPIMVHNDASSQIEFLSFGAAVENGASNTRRLYINDELYTDSVWVVPYSALTAGDVVRGETVYTNANGTYVNESNSVTYQGQGFATAHAILTDAHAGTTPGFYAVAGDSTRDNPVDDSQMMQRYYPRQIGKINNLTLIDNAGYGQSTQNWAGDVASPHVGDLITAISGTGATTIVELSLGINDPVSVALIKDRLHDGFARLISERPDAVVVPVVPSTTGSAGENANLRQAYAEFAQELGLPLIDTASGMDAVYDFGSGNVFYSDDKHPTSQGSARLIHIIMDALVPVSLRTVVTIDDMHREPGDGIPAQPLNKAELLAGLSLNLAIDNTAPVAVDDTGFTTPFETAILLDLLANDTDLNGDDLTLQSVSSPVGGTVVITDANAGTATFTPAADFDGAASFDYVVSDGTDTDTGSVSGTVAEEIVASIPPEINSVSLGQISGNTLPIAIDVTEACQVDWVMTTGTEPNPDQVAAGDDHADAAATASGSFTISAAGTINAAAAIPADIGPANFQFWFNAHDGAGDRSANVVGAGPIEINTNAPSGNSISSISGSPVNSQQSGDEVYEWTGAGSFIADGNFSVTALVVGGGAGGGRGTSFRRGGGGGGGQVQEVSFNVVQGETYNIAVGAGGSGAATEGLAGADGSASTLAGTNAPAASAGGSGGGSDDGAAGVPGTSGTIGGGASGGASTPGIGTLFDGGGNSGTGTPGGGGGAGGDGGDAENGGDYTSGAGGIGISSAITGAAVGYGGGGAGGTDTNSGATQDGGGAGGVLNGASGEDGVRGGGGGGAGGLSSLAGTGGGGLIIVRFTP